MNEKCRLSITALFIFAYYNLRRITHCNAPMRDWTVERVHALGGNHARHTVRIVSSELLSPCPGFKLN